MTSREAFEAWAGKRERYHTTREWDAMRRAWQASTASERERCAQAVISLEKQQWFPSQKALAEACADAIRKGEG